MPLTILHVSTRLILGGSQENTVLSCEGQAEAGHDVHLAYGPIYGPEGSLLERVRLFRANDGRAITCHEIPHMLRPIRPIADVRTFRALRALVSEIGADVVHTHSSKAGIIGRAAAWAVFQRSHRPGAARPNRPAVIHTIHGPPFHRYLPRATNAMYVAAERYAAKKCHAIVSVADAMTEQYLARGIGRPEQYTTVYSGIEVDRFLTPAQGEDRASVRAQLGLGEHDFVIGTVARLAELKGHDDIIDALGPELRTRRNWKLLWVGDGWWKDRLLEHVRTLGLRHAVVTTGLVPQERVAGLMRAMDLLVHPSYREGLPRTVPQALLCTTPVVASDADGTREVCRDGETGRLFPIGDAADLREAVVWMHDHAAERRAMAEKGREMCREMFDSARMVEALDEVYAKALAIADEKDGKDA